MAQKNSNTKGNGQKKPKRVSHLPKRKNKLSALGFFKRYGYKRYACTGT